MGCYCAHKYLDLEEQEEVLMVECERALGLSDFASGKLCAEIDTLAVTGKLDMNRLQQLWSRIHLEVTSPGGKKSPVTEFYQSLMTRSDWSAKPLSVLSLLLGRGSTQSKAELLFALYQHGDSLSAADTEVMAKDLTNLALVALPGFCTAELEFHAHLDAAVLIQNYATKLEEAKSYAEKLMKVMLFERRTKDLDLAGFKDRVTGADMLFLFSSKALRREALETYKKMQKKYVRQKGRDSSRVQTV